MQTSIDRGGPQGGSAIDAILAIIPGTAKAAVETALSNNEGDCEKAVNELLKNQFAKLAANLKPTSTPTATSVTSTFSFPGRKKALLIGINYFGSKHELRGCIEDVRRLQELLAHGYGFSKDPNWMTVLTDDLPDRRMHPTKLNITYAMRWLVDGAKPGDSLFFHFSGHGSKQVDLDGQEDDGYDETILPCDYKTKGMIVDDQIHDELVASLPSGVKLTAVFDCCHSGTGMDLPFTMKVCSKKWDVDGNPRHAEADVMLISGCMDDQTSADLQCPKWGCGGAMSFALVGALASSPNGHSVSTLLGQLQQSMRARGFTQIPQVSSSQQFDLSRPFSFDDILPNLNATTGRVSKRKKKRVPKEPPQGASRSWGDDPRMVARPPSDNPRREKQKREKRHRVKVTAWDLSSSSSDEN
eukprot:Polyplicarium_translucidae@DN2459_c0_g1_i3.p1